MKKVVIGSGSAFWGDMLEPAIEMAERSDVKYIGFDHLAELTMAILSRMKAKDPESGYIPDIVPWMRAILPVALPRGIKLITNAGGANPLKAAEKVCEIARESGLRGIRVGVVWGDDVLNRIDDLRAQGWRFRNLDTEEEDIDQIRERIVAANAYIGAEGIIEQLEAGADVIVTGRVSDNALYVGPIMHEFGWDYTEKWTDKVAAAITVGHIIECSACATGGMSNMWHVSERQWEIGFPIAEVFENGEAVITKTPGSGGIVNEWTIKEHLLYEIADPSSYIMPDGIADFTTVTLKEEGPDRVRISNMSGRKRPETLKVCIGYRDGFIGEGWVFFPWPDALAKAKWSANWITERVRRLGLQVRELRLDLVGVNMLHGECAPVEDKDFNEVGLRVAAKTLTYEEADRLRREVTHLWTMGPVGTSFGVPLNVRPVIALWPTLIPREVVRCETKTLEVN